MSAAPLRVATWLGIGDCHWVATKLRALSDHHGGRPIHAFVNESPFHDSVGFLRLVPAVARAERSAEALYRLEDLPEPYTAPRWSTLEGSAGWRGFDYLLIANGHLERGLPLSSWLPELATEYRYPLLIPEADRAVAREIAPPGAVLLYPSGVHANHGFHRNTWKRGDWAEVVRRLNAAGVEPVLMGAASRSDTQYRDRLRRKLRGLAYVDAIGRTTIPQALALIEDAAVWCGLNSGLGIVSAMRGTPTVMLWSDARYPIRGMGCGLHPAMQRSWLAPDQLATYRTLSFGAPALTPAAVVEAILDVRRAAP